MDLRKSTRYECDLPAMIESQSGKISCRFINFSKTGARLSMPSFVSFSIGQKIIVTNDEITRVSAIIRWLGMGEIGMEFEQPLDIQKMSALVEISSPSPDHETL